jgi:hypothetical protein
LLYCGIAARHHAAVVPDFLTGYRQSDETMSRDVAQMHRSWRLVAAELRGRHPELRADIEAGEVFAMRWLLGRALWKHDLRAVWTVATEGPPASYVLATIAAELGLFAGQVAKGRVRRLANWMFGPAPAPALTRRRFPVGAIAAEAGD